ncbi:hypothetical protein COY14_03630 [Candidatus Roizmanbacteria bacterium CG_4_10_14_0_2_um_filter_36_9]|uniref:DUF3467 domain-containing protein n=1 Tax=Candidatus Roizmanbacteria bacterium CG_4_10_14_0_2_um_filter_36_9 TaxID=1974823 RepID=A0A2M7U386_9BACT|nr:MAG: hypothetical protein COY14_03630 [Candidatus Roizmanbacteria bacterium CG_4_10_14_0_2_um_filter_36_9]
MVKEKIREIKVKPLTYFGSQYSQTTTVTVTDSDVTLDFIYIHPNESVKEAQVISRVTLPKNVAIELANAINETTKKHEKKSIKQN